jgi:hypothetical protein
VVALAWPRRQLTTDLAGRFCLPPRNLTKVVMISS